MNLTASIESAELRFRQILEDFFVAVYGKHNLHSHGINHHRRVWSYAKEILLLPVLSSGLPPVCDPEKLLIACYMHDIGMMADPGPRHGIKSRQLCYQFLKSNSLNLNDCDDLLETIENHDNKDYTTDKHASNLLKILSLADDLDAFGFIGIYRYCEIYLKRGIAPEELGERIRKNASARFDNFEKVLSGEHNYISKHRTRYEILDDFFVKVNKQAKEFNFDTDSPKEYCGVVQLFMKMVTMNLSIRDFFIESRQYNHDAIIEHYLTGLKTELSFDKVDE